MGWLIAGVVAAVVGAVASIGTGIANVESQKKANEQNIELQREAWDKNTYQSRVEDANNAGISKWLVANGTPSYSLNTSVKSPDFSGIGSGLGKLSDTFSGVVDKKLALQNTLNAKAQYDNLQSQKDLLDSQVRGQNIRNMQSAWDFMKYQERGVASNDTSAIKNWTALASVLGIDEPGKKGSVEAFFEKMLGGNDSSVLGTKPTEIKKPKYDSSSFKTFNNLKKGYNDAWRTNSSNIGEIKYNPHYK